jgi:hypothetical protein
MDNRRHARLPAELPPDPRELLAKILAQYPDRQKCFQLSTAMVLDDPRLMRGVIEYAFHEWTSRAPR